MLRIRLQRLGRKKQPTYRFVVSERARDTQGNALEIVGHYNPVAQPKILELKVDRIKHWISVGAQPSATVHNLLVKEGILTGKKHKSVTLTNKRRAKLAEKEAAAEEAKKAAEEAAKAAAEAEKAAAEAPAEEPATEEAPTEEAAPDAAEEKTEESAPAEETEEKTEEAAA